MSDEHDPPYALTVIGIAHTPLQHRRDAPCQPGIQRGVEARIELHAPFAPCADDLEGFDRVWVLYVFDRNQGWRPKVRPPRDTKKRGLFATRGPHRPSPVGMVAARLISVDGRTIRVGDVDMLDGTPVVDIKPYLPAVDAFPDARFGWVEQLDGSAPNFPVGAQAETSDEQD